jgi:predicted Zn-dependent protease
MKPVQEQLGLILDLAKQGGAEADVILSQNRKLALKAHAGAVSDYTVASTRAVGIRVIRDGRVGTSYSETLDDEPLESAGADLCHRAYHRNQSWGDSSRRQRQHSRKNSGCPSVGGRHLGQATVSYGTLQCRI